MILHLYMQAIIWMYQIQYYKKNPNDIHDKKLSLVRQFIAWSFSVQDNLMDCCFFIYKHAQWIAELTAMFGQFVNMKSTIFL